jgi:two-component system response regulator WspF
MVFQCLGAGAIDAVNAPVAGGDPRSQGAPLLAKIDLISSLLDDHKSKPPPPGPNSRVVRRTCLIAIGASAGGPAALAAILGALPPTLPAAIVIVQHVDASFADSMADWLNQQSELPVKIAQSGARPQPGTVLLAGTNDHLRLIGDRTLTYTSSPAGGSYRPSIDVFFESAARFWKGSVVGVLLTGMGRDGAAGLKTLRQSGAITIAQDEASSVVYGMPKAAAALEAAGEILPLPKIAPRLIEIATKLSRMSR